MRHRRDLVEVRGGSTATIEAGRATANGHDEDGEAAEGWRR